MMVLKRSADHRAIVAALLATCFVFVGCGLFARPTPDTADACIQRGFAKAKADPAGALEEFDRAVVLDPGSATPWVVRGRFLGDHDQLDGALVDLNHAVTLSSTPGIYFQRGLIFERRADYPKATKDFSAAIRGDPSLADAWAHRCASRVLGPRKDWTGAFADCTRAIKEGPNRSAGYFSRALVRFLRGAPSPQVITDCDRAIALDPDHYQAYALRAAAQHASGRRTRACADVRQARSLRPTGSRAWETTLARLESDCR